MHEKRSIQTMLERIQLIHSPRSDLATFGATTIDYFLASAVPGETARCHLRQGQVTAQKPAILTPERWRERFEGFGDDQEAFGRAMDAHYGASLRGLEYQFRNNLRSTSVEHASLPELIARVQKTVTDDNVKRTALLQAPEAAWSLAVMKLIVDVSLRSFPGNVRELDERGFFDPAGRERSRQRHHIEQLFVRARADVSLRSTLAETLRGYGLFSEYEDRFFSLVS
jgi:hypothetical protein